MERRECKCGCGREISSKWGKYRLIEYIKGHARKNSKNSLKHNQAISQAHKNGKYYNCIYCKNELYIVKSQLGRKKYCSKKCYNLGMIGRKIPLESAKKSALARIGHKVSQETRDKISLANSGQNNGMYKHGKGYLPHDSNFTRRFKKQIRERDNYICMNCGIHNEKLKKSLAIHHINYNKELTVPQNCISLCITCHNLTNFNREYWIKLLQHKLSNLYNYKYSDNDDILINLGGGKL